MITSKRFQLILAVLLTIAVVFTGVFCFAPQAIGVSGNTSAVLYEEKLFDGEVLQIDIQVDENDWNEMLENATQEEYISCDVVINGETFTAVGIRPKGNTSLTQVASTESDRFSFKIEFDHYNSGQTCYGLDKLVLNNNYCDPSYMKEYLSYQMFSFLDVATPLCTYANITVNGEDWGLYLAVEGMEEAFAQRNYGADYGQLYKVETMEMGGGGDFSGPDGEGMAPENMPSGREERPNAQPEEDGANAAGEPGGEITDGGYGAEGSFPNAQERGEQPQFPEGQRIEGETPPTQEGEAGPAGERLPTAEGEEQQADLFFSHEQGGGPEFGSDSGASLLYHDDNPESYDDIFSGAVFDTDESDQQRVIEALAHLNSGEELENYIDVDEVLRYFAVNTMLVNLDSYVSSLKHNYYLYEEDGQLSILPWDFNLSFGTFQAGSATSAVNFPIDTPVSGVSLEERPLIAKLLEVEEYKEQYHAYLQQLVEEYFNSGLFAAKITQIDNKISQYVQQDATAFYSYEEYQDALDMLKAFGLLRAQSVAGQLTGMIPSTEKGQQQNPEQLIDASTIDLSVMGQQGGGGGRMEEPMQHTSSQSDLFGEMPPPQSDNEMASRSDLAMNTNRPQQMGGGPFGSFDEGGAGGSTSVEENVALVAIGAVLLITAVVMLHFYQRKKLFR